MHTVVGCALGVPLRVHVHGEKQRGARASLGCLPWRRHARDQHIQVAIQRVAPHHAGGRLLAGAWCARRRAWAPDVAQRAGAGTPVDVHGQAAPRCARRSSCCVEASLRVLRRSGGRVRAALEGSAKEAQVASAPHLERGALRRAARGARAGGTQGVHVGQHAGLREGARGGCCQARRSQTLSLPVHAGSNRQQQRSCRQAQRHDAAPARGRSWSHRRHTARVALHSTGDRALQHAQL